MKELDSERREREEKRLPFDHYRAKFTALNAKNKNKESARYRRNLKKFEEQNRIFKQMTDKVEAMAKKINSDVECEQNNLKQACESIKNNELWEFKHEINK